MSPKSAIVFASGCCAGFFLAGCLFCLSAKVGATQAAVVAFTDVPASHPAAKAVGQMAAKGLLSGYPDGKYRGDKPVTRYELAVVLARFAQYYDTSKQPLPAVSATVAPSPAWAAPSRQFLMSNGFLPAADPLIADAGSADVKASELALDFAMVMDRIVDRSMPLQHP